MVEQVQAEVSLIPFKSAKQRAFLFANEPAVARKFAADSKGGAIPRKLKKKSGSSHNSSHNSGGGAVKRAVKVPKY